MISVDTNIIFSALYPPDVHHKLARERLVRYGTLDALVLSPPVYSEIIASPDDGMVREFLVRADIQVLWDMPREVWERAGKALGQYAKERRKGVLPRRIAADFVIAAHAEFHSLDIMTFDETVYKAIFPKLKLIK